MDSKLLYNMYYICYIFFFRKRTQPYVDRAVKNIKLLFRKYYYRINNNILLRNEDLNCPISCNRDNYIQIQPGIRYIYGLTIDKLNINIVNAKSS